MLPGNHDPFPWSIRSSLHLDGFSYTSPSLLEPPTPCPFSSLSPDGLFPVPQRQEKRSEENSHRFPEATVARPQCADILPSPLPVQMQPPPRGQPSPATLQRYRPCSCPLSRLHHSRFLLPWNIDIHVQTCPRFLPCCDKRPTPFRLPLQLPFPFSVLLYNERSGKIGLYCRPSPSPPFPSCNNLVGLLFPSKLGLRRSPTTHDFCLAKASSLVSGHLDFVLLAFVTAEHILFLNTLPSLGLQNT